MKRRTFLNRTLLTTVSVAALSLAAFSAHAIYPISVNVATNGQLGFANTSGGTALDTFLFQANPGNVNPLITSVSVTMSDNSKVPFNGDALGGEPFGIEDMQINDALLNTDILELTAQCCVGKNGPLGGTTDMTGGAWSSVAAFSLSEPVFNALNPPVGPWNVNPQTLDPTFDAGGVWVPDPITGGSGSVSALIRDRGIDLGSVSITGQGTGNLKQQMIDAQITGDTTWSASFTVPLQVPTPGLVCNDKTFAPANIAPSASATTTITFTADSEREAMESVVLTDEMDSELMVVNGAAGVVISCAGCSGGTWTTTVTEGSPKDTLTLEYSGSIATGTVVTAVYQTKLDDETVTGTFGNEVVSLTGTGAESGIDVDADVEGCAASITIQPRPQLACNSKVIPELSASGGVDLAVTVIIQNAGTGSITDLLVADTMTGGMELVAGSSSLGARDAGSTLTDPTWSNQTLSAGQTETITYNVNSPQLAADAEVCNQINLSSADTGLSDLNNPRCRVCVSAPPAVVPAISTIGLTAALIGLPLIGGFVARRRNRKA